MTIFQVESFSFIKNPDTSTPDVRGIASLRNLVLTGEARGGVGKRVRLVASLG